MNIDEILHEYENYRNRLMQSLHQQKKKQSCMDSLLRNKNIKFLEMDKGRSTVIIDRAEYEKKLEAIFMDEEFFKRINHPSNPSQHPSLSLENKVQRVLRQYLKPVFSTYQ